jgi:hypothetical protein
MQGPEQFSEQSLDASTLPHGLKGPVMDPPWVFLAVALLLMVGLLLVFWWWRRLKSASKSVTPQAVRDFWAEFEASLLASSGADAQAGPAKIVSTGPKAGAALCAAIRADLAKLGFSPALTLSELEKHASDRLSDEVMGALRLGERIVFAGEVVSSESLSEAALRARQKLTQTVSQVSGGKP